jgi:hypothetical protein
VKRFLLILLALLFLSALAYLAYLNETVFPQKIRAALIEGLEESTGKKVSINSARFDIFKGLVVKDMRVSDGDVTILSADRITSRFLIIPIFRKEVVVTSMKLEGARILAERLSYDTFNIAELFFKKPITIFDGKTRLAISRIIVSDGDIVFQDRTLAQPFSEDIRNADIDIKLLADRVVFNADFEIPSDVSMLVKASGECGLLKREFTAKIEVKDLVPQKFALYLPAEKIKIPEGRVDFSALADCAGGVLNADVLISGIGMKFTEGKISAELNATVNAKIKYDIAKDEAIYSGTALVKNLALYGLDVADSIYDIRGNATFNDKSLKFEGITATVMGVPVKASASIADMSKGGLKVNAFADVGLATLKNLMKTKGGFDLPFDMAGSGDLNVILDYRDISQPPAVNGSLSVRKAVLKPAFLKDALDDVAARFDFTSNQLSFKGMRFRHMLKDYRASGTITNFERPGVQLKLDSKDLGLNTLLSLKGGAVSIASAEGRYLDYGFSLQGNIDTTDPHDLKAALEGNVSFELSEGKEPYKSLKEKLRGVKLAGKIKARLLFKGNLNDIADGALDADISCASLGVNDFNLTDFAMNISSKGRVSNIKYLRACAYGGMLEGSGLIDLSVKDVPYQFNGDIKGVKLEELKVRIPALKDKDIAGILQSHFGVKGFSDDAAKFSAWGKLNIIKGNLWQINMFRGIGSLFFRSDYSSVLFEEGSCDFFVKDKSFCTNDLLMKSPLLELSGTVKISFDRKVAASLRVAFTDAGIDAARSSNIAGAIERYSVIEVKGTLDEPQIRMRPDLSAVVADMADSFFSN